MKKLVAGLLAFAFLSIASACAAAPQKPDLAFAKRFELVHAIYGPYFEQIKFEDVVAQYNAERKKAGKKAGKLSKVEFTASKLALVQALADIYTMADLQLQKRLAALAVGKRILSNVPRNANGLAPLPVAQDQFTAADWQAYIKLLKENKDQFVIMNQHFKERAPAALDKREREMRKMIGAK